MRRTLKTQTVYLSALLLFLWSVTALKVDAQEGIGKGRINGVVVDEQGNPVQGATILVESLKYETKLHGQSDDKGRFAVAGMGTGPWRITASKQGYASSSVDMNVSQLRRNPPITFTLKKLEGHAALKTDKAASELFDKGDLLIQQEKYDEALGVFESFREKYPEIYQVHLNIGTCFLKMGELDKAEAEFKLVLDKAREKFGDYTQDPQSSLRAFTGLGEVYTQRSEFDEARDHFTKALEISKEDEVAAYNVGEVFFSHKQVDEAIKYYEMAIEINRDWSKPYLRLGYAYLNKADFDKSLEYFNKFIEMDPENPEVPNVKNVIAAVEKMKK
jgi:tetratricopeptide (TPR) repeat protein